MADITKRLVLKGQRSSSLNVINSNFLLCEVGWKKLAIASLIARNPPRLQDGVCLYIILEKHDDVVQLIAL